jgi:uncharacterized protein
MISYRVVGYLGFILTLVLLTACGSSPKTNFYMLSAERELHNLVTENISVGVWKVKLPGLIDRPEIVTHTGAYTIELADFDRWGGDLGSNMSLLIADELSYHLKTGQVDVSPWSSYRKFDYQVKVHVRNFGGELGGDSEINGAYVILNGDGSKKLTEALFSFKEKVKSKKYSDMAKAMSQLVMSLSEKISTSIIEQENKH